MSSSPVSATSHTETPNPSWVQARAARTDTRCSASMAAASASRPIRSRETTVTREPSGEPSSGSRAITDTLSGSCWIRSGSSISALSSSGTGSSESAAAARRTSVRIRDARQLVQAFSEVALASASVSAASSSSSSRSATFDDDQRERRGVVRVAGRGGLGQQQVPAHEVADQLDLTLVEADPLGDVARDAARRRRSAR